MNSAAVQTPAPRREPPRFPGDARTVFDAVAEFLLMGLLCVLVSLLTATDAVILGRRIGEGSLTETAQHALLIGSMLLFGLRAWRQPASRGASVLVAGFLGCMAIREMDGFLDRIAHGFWVWPALLVAAAAIAFTWIQDRSRLLAGLADLARSPAYYPMLFGLLIVLVFSQTFGSGYFLWYHILDESTVRSFKPAFQEGLELLGYAFLFYGSWRLGYSAPRPPPPSSPSTRIQKP